MICFHSLDDRPTDPIFPSSRSSSSPSKRKLSISSYSQSRDYPSDDEEGDLNSGTRKLPNKKNTKSERHISSGLVAHPVILDVEGMFKSNHLFIFVKISFHFINIDVVKFSKDIEVKKDQIIELKEKAFHLKKRVAGVEKGNYIINMNVKIPYKVSKMNSAFFQQR